MACCIRGLTSALEPKLVPENKKTGKPYKKDLPVYTV